MEKDFGQRLIVFRAKHNLTQQKMAQMCKVSLQTIYLLENGLQKPSKLTRQKILSVIEKEN